jgi:hypothetical protein
MNYDKSKNNTPSGHFESFMSPLQNYLSIPFQSLVPEYDNNIMKSGTLNEEDEIPYRRKEVQTWWTWLFGGGKSRTVYPSSN